MKKFVIIGLILVFAASCRQKSKLQMFPNEMSEMALSMRSMVDKLRQAKEDIERGIEPKLSIEDFKSDHFTDQSFQKEGFDPMADALLLASNKFDETPSVANYELVVNSCKSCHEYMCPGPLELIKTLEIE